MLIQTGIALRFTKQDIHILRKDIQMVGQSLGSLKTPLFVKAFRRIVFCMSKKSAGPDGLLDHYEALERILKETDA